MQIMLLDSTSTMKEHLSFPGNELSRLYKKAARKQLYKTIKYEFESRTFWHVLMSEWYILIHPADPQSLPVLIIIFVHVSVRPSVIFKISQNKTNIPWK